MMTQRSICRTRLAHETLLRLLNYAAKCRSNYGHAIRRGNLDREPVKFEAGGQIVDIDCGDVLLLLRERPTALNPAHVLWIPGGSNVLDHTVLAQIDGCDAAVIGSRHPITDQRSFFVLGVRHRWWKRRDGDRASVHHL